ncbi:hypothetical protein JMN32_09590 [Fulvivirga sp. 29W222]|uniref:Uncharacterized protein n=1 Tax=Fulvivirga marina TaxID=2494733 RepID=A0A937FXI7_9BACT|nr:hypothetical protein [Fulvivirga marina]MBL6446562.1 hypothetical protein [Fulvivirga marina]
MRNYLAKPFVWGTVLFLVIVLVQLTLSFDKNGGRLIYPIDDTYIHIAIARNFVEFGQWGISKYEFSSTSSSLLFGLVLAFFFKLFGAVEIIPLLLNILFSIGLIYTAERYLSSQKIDKYIIIITSICLVVFTPLTSMAVSGMEHTLHIVLTICFVFEGSRILSKENITFKDIVLVSILGVLIAMVRYEGLFLIATFSTIFFLRGYYIKSIVFCLIAISPVIIFGLISIEQGAYFLPNTIIAKSNAGELSDNKLWDFIYKTGDKFLYHISRLYLTVPIVLLSFILYYERKQKWSLIYYTALMTLAAILLHSAFASVGRFFRYEAYLMALSVFSIALWVGLHKENIAAYFKNYPYRTVLIVLLLMAPAVKRSYRSIGRTVQATHNIHDQQIQMAQFLNQNYSEATVMANDIGAIAFFNPDLKVIDMVGLGTLQTLDLIRKSNSDQEMRHGYQKIAKENHASLALIYDHWFEGQIPEQWKKTFTWTITNNVICGGTTVSFYATDPKEVDELMKSNNNYSLPDDVEVKKLDLSN